MSQKYLVGLYIHASDPLLAANQRAALRLYAENMGWTIMIETAGEIEPLIHAAAEHAIQLVLCTAIERHARSRIAVDTASHHRRRSLAARPELRRPAGVSPKDNLRLHS